MSYLSDEQIARFSVEKGWKIGLGFRPRWGEIDAFGHVNHRTHLTWCEEVRNDYFSTLGERTFSPESAGPVVREIGFEYLRSISLDDEILVTGRVVWLRRSSFRMEYAAWSHGVVGRGHAECVWYAVREQRSMSLPDGLRARMISTDGAQDRSVTAT